MAIYNGRILMRKGNEADFDASKLMPGEWAVSLDAGIVRICIEAGRVIRMATYEAFEEDMKQIEAILLECQSIEEAVRRINTEVNNKLNACAEYVQQAKGYSEQAKQYRDEALQFRNEAEKFAPEGYAELKEQVNENTFKIDTVIEKADLGIKETASGEEIHLTDSAEGKAVEFALYGKARQNITSGKQLLPYPYHDVIQYGSTKTVYGITFTVNEKDGSVVANGTATSNAIYTLDNDLSLPSGTYKINCANDSLNQEFRMKITDTNGNERYISAPFEFTVSDGDVLNPYLVILNGQTASNRVLKPMIRLASIADDTYEPYTNGASPNPSYPQEIEVSGASYNLLENTATSKTINGVEFVVNENKSVTCIGVTTADVYLRINKSTFDNGSYILTDGEHNRYNKTFMYVNGIRSDGTSKSLVTTLSAKSVEFTVDGTYAEYDVGIGFLNGATVDLTIYPMIRKASVKNDRYMPFGVGSVEVKSVGKNLLDCREISSKIINGVTYTPFYDNNGNLLYINANGQATSNSSFVIADKTKVIKQLSKYIGKKVIISGCPSDGGSGKYVLNFQGAIKDGIGTTDVGNGIECTLSDFTNFNNLQVYIVIHSGFTANNLRFYPMIRLATDTDDTYQPYKETLSTIPTNGLAGIKVDSCGNYTDQNGQQWICDEVVKYDDGSGKHIQRLFKAVFDGSDDEGWSINPLEAIRQFFTNQITNAKTSIRVLNTQFTSSNLLVESNNSFISASGRLNCVTHLYSTLDEWKTHLASNPMTVLYELAEPIITLLTAEEIEEIETFYPITNISNDFDCGMSVKYNCDSKNYIDNKLAEITKAMISNI